MKIGMLYKANMQRALDLSLMNINNTIQIRLQLFLHTKPSHSDLSPGQCDKLVLGEGSVVHVNIALT